MTAFAADSRLLLAGIGPAGAGKTTAMRALAQVLRQGGRNLVPLAPSAAAADVLGHELGVRAENLHKFIYEWTAGPFAARLQAGALVPGNARMFRLGPGDVILVDEAGMAGTFLLDQLTTYAKSRGAVVRLLGDDRQLPAVDSGGALRLLAREPGTPQLTTLYRFRDPDEAAATLKLRVGDAAAVDWYHARDRIRSGSRQAMTEAAYDGWKTDMLNGKITLMAAFAGTDVTALAARARADRVAAGQVEPGGVRLRDGNLAGRGDWIVTRHNDRRLAARGRREWVKNGDAWTVERRHDDGALTVTSTSHGGRITLPAAYVANHVQLLYATTSHRSQGATVDTAHPLVTRGMGCESLYVLASRARERTTLYVATHDQPDPVDGHSQVDTGRHDPRQYEAREVLLAILANKTAELSATDVIATAQDEAASLAVLVPRYVHAFRECAARGRGVCASMGRYQARETWVDVSRPLPWPPPVPTAAADSSRETGYLEEAAALIDSRVDQLAEAALRDHPAWLSALGHPPQDSDRYAAWLANIMIVAAYRDQCRVAVDDSREALGPHLNREHSGYAARRHAAQAVRAARNLAAPQALPTMDRTEGSAQQLSVQQQVRGKRRGASWQCTGSRSQSESQALPSHSTQMPTQRTTRPDNGPRVL